MNAIPGNNPDNIDAHEVVDTTSSKGDVCCESVSKRTGLKMAMAMTAVLATNGALGDGLPKYESPLGLDYNELVPDEKLRKILIDTNLEKDLIAYLKSQGESNKRILLNVTGALKAFTRDSYNPLISKNVKASSMDTLAAFSRLDENKFPRLHKLGKAMDNHLFTNKLSDKLSSISND